MEHLNEVGKIELLGDIVSRNAIRDKHKFFFQINESK